MTSEIVRQEKPGRLERMRELMLNPLSNKISYPILGAMYGHSASYLILGLLLKNIDLFSLGAAEIGLASYLLKNID